MCRNEVDDRYRVTGKSGMVPTLSFVGSSLVGGCFIAFRSGWHLFNIIVVTW